VSRDAVYAHAEELGGMRIGNGPRGRLRFDLDVALQGSTHRSTGEDPGDPKSSSRAGKTTRQRRRPAPVAARLLPVRGELLTVSDERAGR
jgi:hypothetical protein